jgi:hypothetical protein
MKTLGERRLGKLGITHDVMGVVVEIGTVGRYSWA